MTRGPKVQGQSLAGQPEQGGVWVGSSLALHARLSRWFTITPWVGVGALTSQTGQLLYDAGFAFSLDFL